MEGTAKLTGNVAAKVKANLSDKLSKEMAVRTDDFTKLLQQKKELSQTREQTSKADSAKDSQPKEKEVDTSGDTAEKPQAEEQEGGTEDLEQEALLKAAQQQAMAQMTMAQVEVQPKTAAETVTEAPVQAVEAAVSGEQPQVSADSPAQALTDGAAQALTDGAVQPQTEKGAVPAFGKQEAFRQEKADAQTEEQPLPQISDAVAQNRRADSQYGAAEKGMESSVQTSDSQKVQAEEQEDSSDIQPLYGEDTFRSAMQTRESVFAGQKTEQVPVKTTPETMAQDLGQTLAGRLGNGPKSIVIELEPASLGKLTIRLTYEASRAALSIAATNPRTLELLNQKAGELAAILEEKTGQETLIFTQPTGQEPQQYEDGRSSQGSKQEDREEKHPDKRQEEQQAGSFAQQLRLGLI